MRLRSRILLVVCLFTLLLASSVPQIITFQGRLMSNGSAVTGIKNMRFAIVDNSGNVKWQSHASNTVAVTVNNGIYTVKLGDTSITNMSALTLSQLDQQITLNVRVWVEGEQLSPDIYLSSVPYAAIAKRAETITSNVAAGNSIVSALGKATANVGIGTNSPATNSLLQLDSTTKTFVPPRMTTTQMNAISSPAEGSMIYNTTEDEIYWYSGSNWISIKGTSANASYDTGWIACSDWTDQHLGSVLGGNVTHNLNANLSGLIVNVLISPDGTDTNSFDPLMPDNDGDELRGGYSIFQVNNNSIKVQTTGSGFRYVNDSGTTVVVDTESWYYKIKIYKPNQLVDGVDASTLVKKSGDTMTGKLTAQAGIDVSGNIIPVSDNAYDLGSSTKRWREIYVSGNSIHIGQPGNEIKLSYANGALAFDKPIQVTTTTNGFTVPRMTNTEIMAISSPATGSIVYDTDLQGLSWYNGSGWFPFSIQGEPIGSVTSYFGLSAPSGWLICNGASLGNTGSGADYTGVDYKTLYTLIWTLVKNSNIDSSYASGTLGSTADDDWAGASIKVYLPDLRGVFVRGAGTSAKLSNANGTYFSGTLGTYQNDKLQGHKHSKSSFYGYSDSGSLYYADAEPWGAGLSYTSITGLPSTDGSNGSPRTGTETNPANVSMYYIIKYKNISAAAYDGGSSGSVDLSNYVQKSGSTMTGKLTVQADIESTGKIETTGTINATSGKIAEGGNALVPAGCIQMYGGSTAPGGWLMCNGAAVSRTTYASLYTAIGTTYGAGNGSTTFNLPDFRGIFPRGAGTSDQLANANGVSFNATLGTYQNDELQGHYHNLRTTSGTSYMLTSSYATGDAANGPGGGFNSVQTAARVETTAPVADGSNGTPRTGTETNPANLAVNFIIKY